MNCALFVHSDEGGVAVFLCSADAATILSPRLMVSTAVVGWPDRAAVTAT